MRQIKFRAWFKLFEEMKPVVGFTQYHEDNLTVYFGQVGSHTCTKNDVVLMQSTGLKDKNGKEIYEGDIVRAKNGVQIGTVIWVESDCKYVVRWTKDNPTKMVYDSNMSSAQWGEVIGNIYENPELLEVGK